MSKPRDVVVVRVSEKGNWEDERSYQVRPILEGKNRGRHFVSKTTSPESIAF